MIIYYAQNFSKNYITLRPANFDGSALNTGLSYIWTGPGITAPNNTGASISVDRIGQYTVNISNGFQQCSQQIEISGTHCAPADNAPDFCSNQPFTANLDPTPLPRLAVGDIITAGAFEYTITQVTSATQPFAGKATMNILNGPGNLKAGLRTEFAGISINECYQVIAVPAAPPSGAGGAYFKSEYDPSWGNIFDASTQTPKPAEPGEEINALIALNEKIATEMASLTTNCAQRDLLIQYLTELKAIVAQIQAGTDYTSTEIADLVAIQNNVIISLNDLVGPNGCFICVPGARIAGPGDGNCAKIESKTTTDANNALKAKVKSIICDIIVRAQNTPCTTSKNYNCKNGGAVIIAFPNGNYDLNACRQLLKRGNWIKNKSNSADFDIIQIFSPNKPDLNGNDPVSFDKAAKENIQDNKWNNYLSISDRNSWYVWADKIGRKKDNFWFAAADYVTRWNAVGAADLDLNFGLVTDEEEFVMRSINQRLLQQNFTNFGDYLINNGKVKDGLGNQILLTGQALDEKMVDIEQQEVQNYIDDAKNKFEVKFGKQIDFCWASGKYLSQWQCAIKGINIVSDGTDILGSIPIIKYIYNGFKSDPFKYSIGELNKIPSMVPYDFLLMSHRVFLGKKMAAFIRSKRYEY